MLQKVVSRQGHFIADRKKEIFFGLVVSVIGLVLLWDAYDGRGKKMPWPASGMVPW